MRVAVRVLHSLILLSIAPEIVLEWYHAVLLGIKTVYF